MSAARTVGAALGVWLGEVLDLVIAVALYTQLGIETLVLYAALRLGWLISVRVVADGHLTPRRRSRP